MNAPRLRHALIAPALMALVSCASADWPAFRHDALRTGAQPKASPLSDPVKVKKLQVVWRFPKEGEPNLGEGFRASPIVHKGRVFIGNGSGFFYALDAKTGEKIWQYPPVGSLALDSQFHCNPSSHGIASSATIAKIRGTDAVIFAAPDPSIGKHFGDGRLFALKTRTGEVIWKSPLIARLNGCTKECKSEFHENLGHSSPLVLGDKVYVGVGDHCDNPIQKGRVVAVYLRTGLIVSRFRYCSTGKCNDTDTTRGGGVWSPPAGLQDSVYITTGNTQSGQDFEPYPNYGLSLLRLDAATGKVLWSFQPVPWNLDGDPDWAAAPTIMSTSCGLVVISTQKDGWTHAVNATDGTWRWSFPPRPSPPFPPFRCGDGTCHGDLRYMRSGAAWGNVYVTMNGGADLTTSNDGTGGYRRLHAFNVCEPEEKNRLRWVIDVPETCCALDDQNCDCCLSSCCGSDCRYRLGNPTVTHGIFYIGTHKGHLLVIADPAVASHAGLRCSSPDVQNESCDLMGYRLVPQPQVLKDIALHGSMAYTEPVLANGKVYVSTDASASHEGGYVYMLQP
ncbi:MAG TPA: PQQ-binding-like beta-propeller repeat protein [Thermoanaerobaculia bacterium]|nr:PQQ-binding-like beta-propeller repeat protein [Thermoanaerobaculia bacterium]